MVACTAKYAYSDQLTFAELKCPLKNISDGLSGQRYNSACALVKNLNGDLLVAVAGGSYPGSKGLEVYNPKDGSVTLLSEYLPQEEASDTQVLLKSFIRY